jgi:hypothetical protein
VSTTDTTPDGPVPGGTPPEDPAAVPSQSTPKSIKTGRNLPAAIGVGVGLGGLAVLTLFTVKATFLIVHGRGARDRRWHELSSALKTKRDINLPADPRWRSAARRCVTTRLLGSQATVRASRARADGDRDPRRGGMFGREPTAT